MKDYQKYINALRKCAKEHEGDKTFTGQIIVSNLCRDVADLLEEVEQEPKTEKVIKMRDATPEERESIEKYIKSISKPTGVNFWDLEQEPKTGRWSRKTKVDAYDIAGVKTWGIKCQCDRCDFTTIVVEDFGYYKYCPNCGAKMVEPQESEDKG